ncbi:MAG TPA: DUF4180 domain-containing protein [Pseudonocardiaceae bacterium]|nr:DUF4180 domain-containing protein [Pseudonocardiaceae bacterium]
MTVTELHGTRVMVLAADGPLVASEQDAVDLLGSVFSSRASVVAVPVSRLPSTFFSLRSGVAGAIVQKLVNYRVRLAVVGDISSYLGSASLRAFVVEANRGRDVWFVSSVGELEGRLVESP